MKFYEIGFGAVKGNDWTDDYEDVGIILVASNHTPSFDEVEYLLHLPWTKGKSHIRCCSVTPISKEEIIGHEKYYNQQIINLDAIIDLDEME